MTAKPEQQLDLEDIDILDYDEEGGLTSGLLSVVKTCAKAFIILLFLWSSLLRPFRIPSGSMIPNLQVGDHIMVPMLAYGLRVPWFQARSGGFFGLPIGSVELISWGKPQRGDVLVFKYPPDPSVDYVKRIVAVGGDVVELRDNVLRINGVEVTRTFEGPHSFVDNSCTEHPARSYSETLGEHSYSVLQSGYSPLANYGPVTVPEEHYFALGDNRDSSADSRVWGFIPEDHVVGRAFWIWLSWDTCQGNIPQLGSFRSERFAQTIP